MVYSLDFLRMAESVYAMAALRALESEDNEKVIGREEEGALLRRLEWAMVDVCLALGERVKGLDVREGRVELEPVGGAAPELVFRALEGAVLGQVMAELGLEPAEKAETVLRLLKRAVGGRPTAVRAGF